jgi:thiol-disulfide isomerase/thioredoxin
MRKLLLSFLAIALFSFTAEAQVTNYNVGQTVSNFTVTDVHGNTHDLYSYTAQGKHVVLDFFFDTCGPCQQTTPIFNELHEKYGCNGGDLICISMNNGTDTDAEVIAFENSFGGNFAHAPAVSNDGGAGNVDTDFGISAYPTYCIIAPDNTLANGDIWPLSNVGTFEAAFPQGSNINPMTCAATAVSEIASAGAQITSVYPNPANESANLFFSVEANTNVSVEVYNILGEFVHTERLVNAVAGQNTHTLNTSNLNAGHYVVKLIANDVEADVVKLSIVK